MGIYCSVNLVFTVPILITFGDLWVGVVDAGWVVDDVVDGLVCVS